MGLFPLKRSVDLVRVCYLHISGNDSKALLLINLQKKRLVQSKALQQKLFVLVLGF